MSGQKIIEGLNEAIAFASGQAPASRIVINGHAYIRDPGFDIEFVVEALSMIEDGEGFADEIARQALIAIGRDPAKPASPQPLSEEVK